MKKVDRRSALAVGLAAASTAFVRPAAAQPAGKIVSKDASPSPGVTVRSYGTPTASLIPGFKTVSMRDFIVQPGATGNPAATAMPNPMICHVLEGELQVDQDGKRWTAGKNYVWTCNTGTKESVKNAGKAVAIMRITDLMA
jgi:hypothetical protein